MGALGGLGELRLSTSHEARKTSSAFLRGKSAKASCTVGKGRDCHFQTNGRELTVRGRVVARRAAPNTDVLEVCLRPGASGEERAIANLVMRGVRAGINARDVRGSIRVAGRRGRAAASWPTSGCLTVKVPPKIRKAAAEAITSAFAAEAAAAPAPAKGRAKGGAFDSNIGKAGAKAQKKTTRQKKR